MKINVVMKHTISSARLYSKGTVESSKSEKELVTVRFFWVGLKLHATAENAAEKRQELL